MKIEQAAGQDIRAVCFTDGAPLATSLFIGNQTVRQLSMNDLHDLRYCVDRMIARLEPHVR